MMLHVIIAAFVVACSLTSITLAFIVLRRESIVLDEPTTAAKPLPEWLRHRMDIPQQHPAVKTRRSRSLR